MSRAWRYFGSTIDELVGDLRNTIVTAERPPYCSGTLTLTPEDFVLFFGKENEGPAWLRVYPCQVVSYYS